jgi:hypothetical protein
MHNSVKVSNFVGIHKNTLVGKCDCILPPGMKINGLMLHEKSGKRWVQIPSKEWISPAGDKKFFPIVGFENREAEDRFGDSVLPAVEAAFKAAGAL